MIKAYTIIHHIPSGICWSSSTRPRLCQTRSSMTFCVKWKHTIVSILSWKIARKSPTTSNKPIKISDTKTWWTWKSVWNKNEKTRTTKILHPCSCNKFMVGYHGAKLWASESISKPLKPRRNAGDGWRRVKFVVRVRRRPWRKTLHPKVASQGKQALGWNPKALLGMSLKAQGRWDVQAPWALQSRNTPEIWHRYQKWPIFKRSRHFQTIILGIHVYPY